MKLAKTISDDTLETVSTRISAELNRQLEHKVVDRRMSKQQAHIEALLAWVEDRILHGPVMADNSFVKKPASEGIALKGEQVYTRNRTQKEHEIMERMVTILRHGPAAARDALLSILDLATETNFGNRNPVPSPPAAPASSDERLLIEADLAAKVDARPVGISPGKATAHPPVKKKANNPGRTGGSRTA